MDSPTLDKDGKWSVATFSVFSEVLTSEEIGAALGLEATRTRTKGQPRGFRKKDGSISQSIVWPDWAWHLKSPLGYDADLTDHIKWLLEAIEPRVEAIKELSAKCRPIRIMCGFSSENGQGGFTLDSMTLARLAKTGLPLVVDLYPPGQVETGGAEQESDIGNRPSS